MAKKGLQAVQLDLTSKDITLFDVFGGRPITPFEVTKYVWSFVKKNQLRIGYTYDKKGVATPNGKKELVNA